VVDRWRQRRWIPRLLGGVGVAGIAVLLASALSVGRSSIADRSGWAVAGVALVLVGSRRIGVLAVLFLAAGAGILLYR
jgi:chromate transport protein ChrA